MTGDARGWILVVEDDDDIRAIVCMILEENGLSAVGARDGLEALERLRQGPPPAVVLLDLMMPRMDGWQFRKAQLLDPALNEIPVLVVSGDGRVEAKAASLGAAGYVRKPVGVDELIGSVERHRRLRDSRRPHRGS
jgi:CheY-like chemotaxis protein